MSHTLKETIELAVKNTILRMHPIGKLWLTLGDEDPSTIYSNGIQLCWGTATLNGPATATNKRITFPQAFKSGTVTVYTTHDTNVGHALADVGWVSNTAFSIGTLDNSGSTVHTGWLATGRWK